MNGLLRIENKLYVIYNLSMRGVINVAQLGLTKEYLSWNDNVRKETCKKIVESSLATMNVPATKEERINIMFKILDTSIKMYEIIEDYESCQILADVKKALQTI